MIEILVRT